MRGNTIELQLAKGKVAITGTLFQYDYGQRLILYGAELPSAYEVHFSNDTFGNSKTSIGDASGVDIPDEYLLNGKDINVWVFLHQGESDGETEYCGIIHVAKRAKPTDEEPTPVQQSEIDQAIAALNNAVAQCEADVEKYPVVIDGYWCVWDEETQKYVSTGTKAKGDKGDPGDTGATPDFSVGTVSTLQPGKSVTVTITGTPENPVLNVGIPKGDKGDTGEVSEAELTAGLETKANKANPVFTGSISFGRQELSWLGDKSTALGTGIIANRLDQLAFGEYNVSDPSGSARTERGAYVEMVGNGTAANSRSNARTLDWDGNERLKGDLYVGCNADSTGGTKVISESNVATDAEMQDMINDYYGGGN